MKELIALPIFIPIAIVYIVFMLIIIGIPMSISTSVHRLSKGKIGYDYSQLDLFGEREHENL